MAASKATFTTAGPIIVSHIDAANLKQEKDLRRLIETLKALLSDEKRGQTQALIVGAIKRLIVLTKRSVFQPSNLENGAEPGQASPSEAQLRELLHSAYIQKQLCDKIVSRFLPSEEDLILLKAQDRLPVLFKNKILAMKLLKEWSPFINLQVIYSNIEAKERSFLFEAIDSESDSFQALSRKLCNWLVHTSASGPKQSPQMKNVVSDKHSVIQELDGSPCRDFFTVLNIAQVYSNAQLNNIYTFSMLMHWLIVMQQYDAETWNYVMKKLSSEPRAATAMASLSGQGSFYLASSSSSESSSGRLSLASSLSSLHSFRGDSSLMKAFDDSLIEDESFSEASSPHHLSMQSIASQDQPLTPISVSTPTNDGSLDRHKFSSASLASHSSSVVATASTGGLTLKSASVKYCLRILSQAEKIPGRLGDKGILIASVIEAVRILTLLCQEDELLLNNILPKIKRVNSRILGKSKEARRFYPADIQFFIEHYEGINAKGPIDSYFRLVPAQLFTSSSASFELLDLCLRNQLFFERHPSFLSKFFPNLFKIAAWHPRSFLHEFLQLMPALVSETTCVELFHTILDIPCTTALLELSQHRKLDSFLEDHLDRSSQGDHVSSFLSKSHRFISDFFTRCESGGPETIDKLDRVYLALQPLSQRYRVHVSAQIVPVLLQKFFQCLYELKSNAILELIMPSILERVFLLHQCDAFQCAVRSVFASQIMKICSKKPSIVSTQQNDFLSIFKQVRIKDVGLQSVISSIVSCVGEFSIQPGVCNVEQIAKYYEMVETLLYETKQSLFSPSDEDVPVSAEVISSLISTAGKLAACSQDFVPKTILSLTKLANQKWRIHKCTLSQREYEIVTSRAIDVINLLRLPDVSPSVLCSANNAMPWKGDKNTSMLLKVQAMARTDNTGSSVTPRPGGEIS
eukprot:gene9562-10550_t